MSALIRLFAAINSLYLSMASEEGAKGYKRLEAYKKGSFLLLYKTSGMNPILGMTASKLD